MKSQQEVTAFLQSTGLWTPENKPKYDFRLSPDVFTVSKDQIAQMKRFAKKLKEFFRVRTGRFPYVCKTDIMIDTNGNLKIAEIDGLNKRAFGYAIIERIIAKMFGHNTERFMTGIETVLKLAVGSRKLFIVVPGREKYYGYGFNILIERLREIGMDASWGHEKESVRFLNNNEAVLLDIPKTGHEKLDSLLSSRNWDVLIPNEQLFSSKENMVDLQDSLIPKTLKFGDAAEIPFEKYVIKHIGKSGCKGVFFHDQSHELNPSECIIQEFVEGKQFELGYFDGENVIRSSGWQVRLIVTLDLVNLEVADIDVTARQHRLVHGATDSIQIAGVYA